VAVLKRVSIRDLAKVRGGHVAQPGQASPQVPDAHRALQAGDLTATGTVPWPTLRRVIPVGDGERFAIREGDVLVPLRSARVSSLVARGVLPRTIAVGHWAIITTKPEVLPEYLAWYLAHPANARAIGNLVVGSSLPFMPLSALREMEIEVPALAIQQQIVRVESLHRRHTELEQRLTQTRERYVNAITRAALERPAQHEPQSTR
jgi:hypothetical protein